MSAVEVPQRQRPYDRGVITPATLAALDARRLRQVCEMTTRLRFGLSSASLVKWAIVDQGQPFHGFWPFDWDDLERCELAYAIAPKWLAYAMRPQLLRFREYVAARCTYADPTDRFKAS